jgi:transcription elongation factor Elf1
MEKEIKEFLSEISPAWRSRKILDHPLWLDYIRTKYPNYTLAHAIHFFMNGMKEPACKMCGGPLKLPKHDTCSTKCREDLKVKTGSKIESIKKTKQTLIKKYGVENVANIPDVQHKRKQTMIEKYGAHISDKSRNAIKARQSEFVRKSKETLLKNHGVENPGQLPNHREKCVETLKQNYGVDHFFKSKEYKNTRTKERLNHWQLYSPSDIVIKQLKSPVNSQALDRIEFTCLKCNSNSVVPTETFKWRITNTGTPCSTCGGITNGSLKEKQIADFVNNLGFDIIRNCRNTLRNNKELDIVIPDHNLAIEFNGLYWHNDMRVEKNYHLDKLNVAHNEGLKLITIFEDEWDNKPNVVKNRLMYALGVHPNKLGARECSISTITTTQAKKFVNDHHLQGYTPSSVKLGLIKNHELMAVMTFSKLSRSKSHTPTENSWELSRFCTHQDWSISGAASRLFKHFVKNYSPEQVISFADKRWGNGNVYNSLGFEFNGDTSPGYWYIKNSNRIHRFALRKNSNDDQSLTEYENRLAQGYLRIWDCGHSRWIWRA